MDQELRDIKNKITKDDQADALFAYLLKAFKYMQERNKGLYFANLPSDDQESLLKNKEYLDLDNQYQTWSSENSLPKLSLEALIILMRAMEDLHKTFDQIHLSPQEILELTDDAFKKAPPLK